MGGSFGVRCKLFASQGAALHPVAFEKATPKLYYGVVGAGAVDLMCLCAYRLPQGHSGSRKYTVLSEAKRNLSAKVHFY